MSTDTDRPTEKKTAHKVGEAIAVRPAGIVTRPDGSSHIVVRGVFYLDQPGTFIVDGTEVTAQ